MPILAAHKLTKEFADRTLIKSADFSIEKGDKVGFIGANGVGKTTLFKMIMGKEEPTSGEIIIAFGTKVGYLEQHVCSNSSKTAFEETLTVFNELMDIEKELEKARKNLASLEGKLSNENFVSRAPEAVVQAEREKAQKAKELITQLEQSQAAMQKLQ